MTHLPILIGSYSTSYRVLAAIDANGADVGCEIIAAEIDRLTAELAQRALERDAVQETLGMCQRWSDDTAKQVAARLAETTAQLAEARAEVERLRPAAEAWEKGEAYTILIRQMGASAAHATPEQYEAAKAEYEAAAARARAAKVKP